jgi:hypothetical protein
MAMELENYWRTLIVGANDTDGTATEYDAMTFALWYVHCDFNLFDVSSLLNYPDLEIRLSAHGGLNDADQYNGKTIWSDDQLNDPELLSYIQKHPWVLDMHWVDREGKVSIVETVTRSFSDTLYVASYGRRMFKRIEGNLGLGHSSALDGDTVVVLSGGRLPFVLRHVGGTDHSLIGGCYIHGVELDRTTNLTLTVTLFDSIRSSHYKRLYGLIDKYASIKVAL